MPNRRGLRIMHFEHVVFGVEQLRRLLVGLEICVAHDVGQLVVGALQRVVNSLGHGEEIRLAVNEMPVGLNAKRA
jgi:hypothetical protein